MSRKTLNRSNPGAPSGDFYRYVVDLSPNPILVFVPLHGEDGRVADFTCQYANPRAESIFSPQTQILEGIGLCSLLPSDVCEAWLARARTVLETGEPVTEPLTLTTGTPGHTITYQATLHHVDGTIVLRLYLAQDRMQQALAESEERYRALTNAIYDFAYALKVFENNAVELEWMTGNYEQITGIPAEERIRMLPSGDPIHPDDQSITRATTLRAIQQETPAETDYRVIHVKTGEVRWIRGRVIPVIDPKTGRVVRLYGAGINITEYKQAEQALADSEERYRAVVNAVSDYAYSLKVIKDRTDVEFEWLTPRYRDITGYTVAERIVTHPTGLPVHPDDQAPLLNSILRAAETRTPLEIDYRVVHKETGDSRWIRGRMTPDVDPETGQVRRVYGGGRDITGRKQAEQALAASEARYRAVVNAVSDYAYSLRVLADNSVEIEWLTPNYEAVTGISTKDRLGTIPSGEPIHPDDRALAIATTHRAIETRKPAETDYRIIRADTGETRWIRGRLTPEVDPTTGRVVRIYGSGTDITVRKQAEQALADSERQMATLLDNLPGMAYRCQNDRDWTMLFVSSGCKALTGYTPGELIGSKVISFTELTHPGDRQRIWQTVQADLEAGRPFELEYRLSTKNGAEKTVWERGIGIPQPDGTLVLEGFITDISERRMAQQERKAVLDLLRTTYDNLFDVVLVIDAHNEHIINCNRAVQDIFGYSPDEMLGQPASLLQVDEEHGVEFDRLMREHGDVDQVHIPGFPRRRKDGSIIIMDHMMSTVRDRDGSPLYTVATLRDMTSQLAAEQERRNLLDMLQSTYNSINSAIFVVDAANGIIESCNKGASMVFGYTQDEMTGQQTRLLAISEDSWNQTRAMLSRSPEQPQTNFPNYPMQRKNGDVFPASHTFTAIWDKGGELVRWIWVVRDITEMLELRQRDIEQRQFAEALARSAASLNATLNVDEIYERLLTSITGVFPHTAASIMVLEGSQLRVGYATCDCSDTGNVCLEVGHMLPLAHLPAARKVINGAEPLAIPNTEEDDIFFTREGVRWIRSWVGVPLIVNDEVIGLINLDSDKVGTYQQADVDRLKAFADQASVALHNAVLYEQLQRYSAGLEQAVTDRLKELKEARTRAEAVFRHNPDGVLMIALDGTIQQMNPSVRDIFGIREAEVLGKPLITLLGPDLAGEVEPMQDSIYSGAASSHREVQVLLRSGVEIDLSIVMAPIRDDDQITGIVCTMRDITELKEVERMKDAFASNVSHELRTPITSITLNQKLIRRNPGKQEEYLARIERETERLSVIVDDLLRLSRLERNTTPIKPEPVSLNDLLADFLHDFEPVAQSHGLFGELIPHYRDPVAMADPGLMRHVLSILATNAINYTEDGGFTLVVIRDERRVGFLVSDTGPGIVPAEQEKVWDRFYRGEAGNQSGAPGTGLGLALAREIVRRHNGDIKLDSSGIPGEGTTFTVWLPQA